MYICIQIRRLENIHVKTPIMLNKNGKNSKELNTNAIVFLKKKPNSNVMGNGYDTRLNIYNYGAVCSQNKYSFKPKMDKLRNNTAYCEWKMREPRYSSFTRKLLSANVRVGRVPSCCSYKIRMHRGAWVQTTIHAIRHVCQCDLRADAFVVSTLCGLLCFRIIFSRTSKVL